jgi:hypothetical protein
MAEHQTHRIHVVLEGGPIAPLFIPLLDVRADTTLLASQCTLTVAGCPSPLEVAVMLCKPETALGDPGDAVLYVSDVVSVVAGEPFVLPGSIPMIGQAGVLGLSVPVQTLPPGASVTGTLSTVR